MCIRDRIWPEAEQLSNLSREGEISGKVSAIQWSYRRTLLSKPKPTASTPYQHRGVLPYACGHAAWQLLTGRQPPSIPPGTSCQLQPKTIDLDNFTSQQQLQAAQKLQQDKTAHPLPAMKQETTFSYRRGDWQPGRGTAPSNSPRRYNVTTEDGLTIRRSNVCCAGAHRDQQITASANPCVKCHRLLYLNAPDLMTDYRQPSTPPHQTAW